MHPDTNLGPLLFWIAIAFVALLFGTLTYKVYSLEERIEHSEIVNETATN